MKQEPGRQQPGIPSLQGGEEVNKRDIEQVILDMLLAEAGLQAKNGDAWAPLDAAGGLFRIMDTGKRHGGGAMIQQIKWSGDVVFRVRVA